MLKHFFLRYVHIRTNPMQASSARQGLSFDHACTRYSGIQFARISLYSHSILWDHMVLKLTLIGESMHDLLPSPCDDSHYIQVLRGENTTSPSKETWINVDAFPSNQVGKREQGYSAAQRRRS